MATQSNTRRGFLQAASAAAAGAGLAAGAPAPVLPTVRFRQHEVTRMIVGTNPFFGYSHFNGVLDRFMREWYTMDRRAEVMGQIEAYLDNVLLRSEAPAGAAAPHMPAIPGRAAAPAGPPSDASIAAFAQTVAQLESVVGQFDASLQAFAATTRDFREFNAHLKDNVQRMSLGFGDLSETLKEHARTFKARG